MDMNVMERKIVDIVHVVQYFPDVFPKDLPGVPPERQVKFLFDVVSGATPLVKA